MRARLSDISSDHCMFDSASRGTVTFNALNLNTPMELMEDGHVGCKQILHQPTVTAFSFMQEIRECNVAGCHMRNRIDGRLSDNLKQIRNSSGFTEAERICFSLSICYVVPDHNEYRPSDFSTVVEC